jgi:hypothetical protein
MRVSHAPRSVVLSRPGQEEFKGTPAARGLSSMSTRAGSACRVLTEPPWTPGFTPRRPCIHRSLRRAARPDLGGPEVATTGFLKRGFGQYGLLLPMRWTPRRPTPLHPEASVDLETSLRKGEAIITQVRGGADNLSRRFFPFAEIAGDSQRKRPVWCGIT